GPSARRSTPHRAYRRTFRRRRARNAAVDSYGAGSASDAARAQPQRFEQRLELRLLGDSIGERRDRVLELQSLAIENSIRLADIADLRRRESVPLQAFGVDAA